VDPFFHSFRQIGGPGAFLVIKCVEPQEKLISEVVALEICSSHCFYAETRKILLAAFVVMLDHWHAVLATSDGRTISKRMNILDHWISRQTNELLQSGWEANSDSDNRRWGQRLPHSIPRSIHMQPRSRAFLSTPTAFVAWNSLGRGAPRPAWVSRCQRLGFRQNQSVSAFEGSDSVQGRMRQSSCNPLPKCLPFPAV